ncbi:IS30 family transposase, partial [Enterococcus lactis]|nr:IS30 family transposase [Enterococcus lactis]
MTYKHLTIKELTMIESYYLQHNKPVAIANRIERAK